MMDGPRRLYCGIDPGLHHFEHEEAVGIDHARIGHAAFEAGVALGDERRGDLLRVFRREAEGGELVEGGAAGVAAADDRVGQLDGGNVDDALTRLLRRP